MRDVLEKYLEERYSDGGLTDLASAVDALYDQWDCDCGVDEPGTCLFCVVETALLSLANERDAMANKIDEILNSSIRCKSADSILLQIKSAGEAAKKRDSMTSRKPYRSRAFLAYAKDQRGLCCVCKSQEGVELHHYGSAGMGQKGSDLLVCRVCRRCHGEIQGKRRHAFERLGQLDKWIDIQADGIELLRGYVEGMGGRKGNGN